MRWVGCGDRRARHRVDGTETNRQPPLIFSVAQCSSVRVAASIPLQEQGRSEHGACLFRGGQKEATSVLALGGEQVCQKSRIGVLT